MEGFLEEVKEMTEEDILLAFEQPELYSNEEMEILKKELKNRGISTEEVREVVATQNSTKTSNKNAQIENNIFWTKFSRIVATVSLIFSIIIALFVLVSFCEKGESSIGIAISIVIILLAMLSVAGIMVFVEMSENINRILNKMSKNN